MPTKHCAYGTCTSDSRKKNPNIKFVAFPKPSVNLALSKRWVHLCGRKGFQLKHVQKHSYVCSLHFPPDAVLDTRKNPELEPFPLKHDLFKRQNKRKRDEDDSVVQRSSADAEPDVFSSPSAKACKSQSGESHEEKPHPLDIDNWQPGNNTDRYLSSYPPKLNNHPLPKLPDMFVVKNIASPSKLDLPPMSPCTTLLHSSPTESTTLSPSLADKCSRQKIRYITRELYWRKKYKTLLLKHRRFVKKTQQERQLPTLARSSNQWGIFYTGLSEESRKLLFQFLGPSKNQLQIIGGRSKKTSGDLNIRVEDQFLLTLIKLRQNFPFTDLANRFGITRHLAAKIFKTWIQFMFVEFGEIRDQLFRRSDQIKKPLPVHFQNKFLCKTRIVIDCTEFKVETSRNFQQQGNNYSSYKSHATAKVLIGVAPNGSFSFASDCYEGSISDKEIVKKSGFLDHIQPDDVVLADRGFLIEDLLKEKKAKLVIPPFLSGRRQFSLNETQLTKVIAKARIHVERFMERLKNFKFFVGVISLQQVPILSQAVFVACCLVNFTKTLTE